MGTQSRIVEFKGANKQFSFVEISLVYDKSEQHNTIAEVAATQISSVQLENLNNVVS